MNPRRRRQEKKRLNRCEKKRFTLLQEATIAAWVWHGQRNVLADLLRESLVPLEISVAMIESDDDAEMEALISRVKNALDALDAGRQHEMSVRASVRLTTRTKK